MGKVKETMDWDQYYENEGPEIELEMRLSHFLGSGGEKLGYSRNDYPDPADFNDVLINEIKPETYKKLTFHD